MKEKGTPAYSLTEAQQAAIRSAVRETVLPEYAHEIGEVRLRWVSDRIGIWVEIASKDAYFGQSFQAAMMTAEECDWLFLSHHPPMLDDDWTWFDDRLAHGKSWQDKVTPMKRQESRDRVAVNYCPGE